MSRSVLSPAGRPARRWVVPVAVAAVLAVVAAVVAIVVVGGDGGGGKDGPAPVAAATGADPLAPPGAARRKPAGAAPLAPDAATGVTGSGVRVAVQVPDQSVLRAIGAPVESVDVASIWRVFLDQANTANRAGPASRRIEPLFTTVNPIDATAMRAACLRWTRDQKVFAVLALIGFYGPPVQCVTEENKTIFLTADGQPEQWQDGSSRGLLYSLPANKSRTLRNDADWLDRSRLLRGRTVGLVEPAGFDHDVVESALVPELTRRGYRIASRFTFSLDPGEASRQYALAAAQLRRAGVDTVVATTNYTGSVGLTTAAAAIGYRPRWLYSGFAGGTSTLVAKGLPAGTDALGLAGSPVQSPSGASPETGPNQACRQTYERATGKRLERTSNDYATVMTVCAEVRVFTAGIANAGPRLTRRTFAAGVARIGDVELPGFGASSFRPGKYDGGDVEQVVRLERACRCWAPYPGSRPNPAPFA